MFPMNFTPNQQLKIKTNGSLISTSAYRSNEDLVTLKGSMKIRDSKSKILKLPT